MPPRPVVMPSDITGELTLFDRFATASAEFVSRAWFFALCVLLVLLWAPSYYLVRDINIWELWINTATTIITFLLVALLQNTQKRADAAAQNKLNAIADGLADLMDKLTEDHGGLRVDSAELRAAVGLEDRVSSAPPNILAREMQEP
jgi:low affinity Fe/Cu permease